MSSIGLLNVCDIKNEFPKWLFLFYLIMLKTIDDRYVGIMLIV